MHRLKNQAVPIAMNVGADTVFDKSPRKTQSTVLRYLAQNPTLLVGAPW